MFLNCTILPLVEEGESTNSSASGIRKALIDTKVDITTVEKRVDAEKANLVEREEREEDRGEMILARSGESQDVEKIDDLFATEKVTAKTSVVRPFCPSLYNPISFLSSLFSLKWLSLKVPSHLFLFNVSSILDISESLQHFK